MKLPGRILGIALTLAGLTGAWFLQGVSFQTASAPEPEGISVSTTAKPLQLYCQGPLAELGGKDGTDLGSMALVGKADVRYRLGVGSLVSEPESRVAQGVAIAMASREQTTATLTAWLAVGSKAFCMSQTQTRSKFKLILCFTLQHRAIHT